MFVIMRIDDLFLNSLGGWGPINSAALFPPVAVPGLLHVLGDAVALAVDIPKPSKRRAVRIAA